MRRKRLQPKCWRRILYISLIFLVIGIQSALAAGLRVELTADKKDYARDDVAWITLALENTSEKSIYDIDVRHILPNGLEYVASEDGRCYFEEIPAKGRVTCRVGVQHISSDISISVSSDKTDYKYGEVATLTITVRNNTDKPLYNMSIHHVLPYKLEYIDGTEDGYGYFEQIPAKGAITRRVLVSSIYPDVLVTLDADRETYQPNEVACLTVTIKNRSENALKDIKIEHLLPQYLVYAEQQGDNPVEFARIEPNETKEIRVYVQYIVDESPETDDLTSNDIDELPATGDTSDRLLGMAVAMFCASIVLLGLLTNNKNNERRRMDRNHD